MKAKTRIKTSELTKSMLTCIGTAGAVLPAMLIPSYPFPRYFAMQREIRRLLRTYAQKRVRQALERMRLQGYVYYDPRDDRAPIVLTKKGLLRVTKYRLRDIIHVALKEWDHLWRIVIFDVPEEQKTVREELRRELSVGGFYKLQESVYVTPYTCDKEVHDLCDLLRVQKYVLYFVAASLGPMEHRVRQYFGMHREE